MVLPSLKNFILQLIIIVYGRTGPHWAGCWKNLLQEIISDLQPLWSLLWKRKQNEKRENKEMGWVACWQLVLWSTFFVFVLMCSAREKLRGKKTKRTWVAKRNRGKWNGIGEERHRPGGERNGEEQLLVSAELERDIQTSGQARCTWPQSYCGTESQQRLLGEHDLSHTSRQSSFSASMSYVAVYAFYAKAGKVTQNNELNGGIHSSVNNCIILWSILTIQ